MAVKQGTLMVSNFKPSQVVPICLMEKSDGFIIEQVEDGTLS